MPAGSLSAPPLMTPGPTILATSAALRCSRAISRAVPRVVAVLRRAISNTARRLGWDRQRPVGPRLFFQQPAHRESRDFIDAHQQDRLTAVYAPPHVIDMLMRHEAAQALAIRPVDDCLLHRHDATVFEHELARQLRGGAVGEGRNDGLLQQARSLESGSNDK